MNNAARVSRRDWMAEFPWGVLAFLFIVIFGALALLFEKNLSLGDYLAAISTGAGLLAIGHGVRTHARSAALHNSGAAPPSITTPSTDN